MESTDLQSDALEADVVDASVKEVATRTGFEPVISAVTGRHVDRYTTGPLNFLGTGTPARVRTPDGGDVENRSLFFDQAPGREPAFQSPEIREPFLHEHPLYGAAVRAFFKRTQGIEL